MRARFRVRGRFHDDQSVQHAQAEGEIHPTDPKSLCLTDQRGRGVPPHGSVCAGLKKKEGRKREGERCGATPHHSPGERKTCGIDLFVLRMHRYTHLMYVHILCV